MKNKYFRAFTLIELLVVIAIIGVLATLIVANFNAARERARDATRKSDLRNIQTALRVYYNDYGRNPCSSNAFQIRGCSVHANCTSVGACTWGDTFSISTTGQVYMSTLPDDPQTPDRTYHYELTADPEVYTIKACLENANDPDCSRTVTEPWCDTQLKGCIYEVKP